MTARLKQLQEMLTKHDIDGLFVTEPRNLRYVSGFTGTSGFALVTSSVALFFTDFRYEEQAKEQCKGFQVVNHKGALVASVAERLQALHVHRLGFEQDHLTYGTVQQYREWESVVSELEFVPTSGVIESQRIIKDDVELSILRRAAEIADAAFAHILTYIKPGVTEKEVAFELEMHMRRLGASGPAFDTIVASGWRSSLPHGVATDKILESGELVTMDFGALFDGYHSDLTRTIVLGKASEEQERIYHIVLDAQRKALSAAKQGLTGIELDAVARQYIASQGYGEAFGHSLGHGIGLDIHEDPRISGSGKMVLKPGMVITIEPGIYVSKTGGVRIEDDVLITNSGMEVLTHAPKDTLISV